MIYKNKTNAKQLTGIKYIGSVNFTTKHKKAFDYNEMTYGIYLSPGKLSGYEVCPGRTKECTAACLNGSGLAIMYKDHVNKSRIKKTKLFFEEREFFVRWIIDEIKTAKLKAERLGYRFSVRLNNTSDISPELFYINDGGVKKNLLQIFPDVQFYDYTKVSNRTRLLDKYPNYDLTYSFNGYNMDECLDMLRNGVRVAMVFKNVPTSIMGFNIVDGDKYDMRYIDPKNSVIGLKYKVVKDKLQSNNKFVIQ